MPTVTYYEVIGTEVHVRHIDREHDFIPRVGDVLSFKRYPSGKLMKKDLEEWRRLNQSSDYPKIQADVVAVEHEFIVTDGERGGGTFTVNVHVRGISADEWGDRNEALGYQRGDETLSKAFRDALDAAKRKRDQS